MTKKHFKTVAFTISRIQNICDRRTMAEFNAKQCAKLNPHFNPELFFKACKVERAKV